MTKRCGVGRGGLDDQAIAAGRDERKAIVARRIAVEPAAGIGDGLTRNDGRWVSGYAVVAEHLRGLAGRGVDQRDAAARDRRSVAAVEHDAEGIDEEIDRRGGDEAGVRLIGDAKLERRSWIDRQAAIALDDGGRHADRVNEAGEFAAVRCGLGKRDLFAIAVGKIKDDRQGIDRVRIGIGRGEGEADDQHFTGAKRVAALE